MVRIMWNDICKILSPSLLPIASCVCVCVLHTLLMRYCNHWFTCLFYLHSQLSEEINSLLSNAKLIVDIQYISMNKWKCCECHWLSDKIFPIFPYVNFLYSCFIIFVPYDFHIYNFEKKHFAKDMSMKVLWRNVKVMKESSSSAPSLSA